MKELERDSAGRHWSRLVIDNIQLEDSGEYTCQPAAGAPAHITVTVHVQRETEVQAVLGEGQLYDFISLNNILELHQLC